MGGMGNERQLGYYVPLTPEKETEVLVLLKAGQYVWEISQVTGLPPTVIRRVKLAYRLQRPRGRRPNTVRQPKGEPESLIDPAREADILAMRKEGHSLADIGMKHGVTRERIRQILERNGVFGMRSDVVMNDAELAPFLQPELLERYCVACGDYREAEKGRFCKACNGRLALILLIKTRLRDGRPGNYLDRRPWGAALWLIRKHDVQPEELKMV